MKKRLLSMAGVIGFAFATSVSPIAIRIATAQTCYGGGCDNTYCRWGDTPCSWCWDSVDGFLGCDDDLDPSGSCNDCYCGTSGLPQ